jgi:hypothetical protein
MNYKTIYCSLLLLVLALSACNRCDVEHPELCSDSITVYDTVFVQNKYECKKVEIAIPHEFTICETDKTSLEFGQPVAKLSYYDVRMRATYGCALSVYPDDCVGARDLKVQNLCNRRIKIALIMGQGNFNIWVDPFATVSGGSEKNGYCSGVKQIFILSVEKH